MLRWQWDEKQRLLENYKEDLEYALDEGDDESAEVLITRIDELETRVQELNIQFEDVSDQAESAFQSLNQYREEINKLKRERDEMLAKNATAQAQQQIAESLDGLSMDADIQALQRTRDSINKRVSEAKLSSKLNDNNIDSRLKNIREKSGNARAKQKLARMKAARAAKNQAAEVGGADAGDPSEKRGGKSL